ncbi:MAG: cupin domain-containing protein [Dehalococcoidia bacterium]
MATKVTPKAQKFSLVGQELLSQGRTTDVLARTDMTIVTAKVYAEGGENALHAHAHQDHGFFVVAGEATFHDEDDNLTVVGPYDGILLPAGAYYWFQSSGEGNLVMLRFSSELSSNGGRERADDRMGIGGKPLPGNSIENKTVERIPAPGQFFGR